MKFYYVYILSSLRRALYVGITSQLELRVAEHKTHKDPNSFTARYNISRLVHWEQFTEVRSAIAREKQIKAWRRDKKIALIERDNPHWLDLSEEREEA